MKYIPGRLLHIPGVGGFVRNGDRLHYTAYWIGPQRRSFASLHTDDRGGWSLLVGGRRFTLKVGA